MEVKVETNLEKALKLLKKKLAQEGVLKELKKRAHYEKPSVKLKRKRQEAMRRRRKEEARKLKSR